MSSDDSSRQRIELAWDEAAAGYDAYFGPRFAPYAGVAIGALLSRRRRLPEGAVLVPCVGPGRELCALARAFSERPIVASDLSGAMVDLARQRNAMFANVSVEQADAMHLSPPSAGVAALLSVFGLQLLPEPAQALQSWLELLSTGGAAAVVYWPRDAEAAGPFDCMRRLIRSTGVPDGSWEQELESSIARAGCRIALDELVAFEIQYESAQILWEALTRLGPLRALALARGPELVTRLGAEFVAELGPGPLTHRPAARLLLAERA